MTDTGGSKGEVIEWAERYLPRNVNFVGGHPIVSKGASGPEAADANLFQGRPYCVIPSSRARQDAVRVLTDMINSIGAKPYYVGVEEHDSFVSAVSHLPLLLSVALVGCTSKSASWDDIAQVASNQYGDLTQLAGNDPVASRDVFAGNNEGTVAWIDSFIRELYEIRQILTGEEESKSEALENVFSQALLARNKWRAGLVGPEFRAAERMPSASVSVGEFFTGSSEARRRAFGWGAGGDKDPKRKK